MRRYLILCIVGLGVLMAFALLWGPAHDFLRSYRIKQQRPLVGNITMHVDELYLIQNNGTNHLAVRCRYVGGDPHKDCALQGALLASPGGPELDYGLYGEAASPFGGEGIPVIWQFRNPPEGNQFTMRIKVVPLNTPLGHGVRYVDFTLPNSPKPYP